MKKIKIVILFFLIISFGFQSFAYKQSDFLEKKAEYSELLEKKVSSKLDTFSAEKLKKLDGLVVKLIEKYEANTSLSDNQKMLKLALLYALQDMVIEKYSVKSSSFSITIIDDKRCTDCNTYNLVNQLKATPSLIGARYIYKDFSDSGVEQYLNDNSITKLPAVIFSTNDISNNEEMDPYLYALGSGEYSLQIGAKFDPLVPRSARGLLLLDSDVLSELNANTYIDGNFRAEVTVFEFADLECPFCAKVHNNGTIKGIQEEYGNDVNIAFKHFPLVFHKNAQTAAELVECTGQQLGKDSFFSLVETIFSENNSSKDFILEEAEKLGASQSQLETCLENGDFTNKIDAQYDSGVNLGVSGTPAFIIVNNSTREYEILGGAYPLDSFIDVIDRVLTK